MGWGIVRKGVEQALKVHVRSSDPRDVAAINVAVRSLAVVCDLIRQEAKGVYILRLLLPELKTNKRTLSAGWAIGSWENDDM